MNRIEKRIRTTEQARLRSDVYDALKIRGTASAREIKYDLEDKYVDLKVKHVSAMLVRLKAEGIVTSVKGRNDINDWSVAGIREGTKVDEKMEVSVELKPCPFCGGIANKWDSRIGLWNIMCNSCGATQVDFSEEGVVYKWNRRVDDGRLE